MSELKRTVLYQAHLDAGATMVDFGGWDMPIQYPDGIVAEHLYCRSHCAIFDVSHMGRIDVEGPDMVRFLQHVLSSNVQALDLNQAQYCIIPDKNGYAIDDEENELGVRCVAVAIPGADGRAESAFSISGLAPYMTPERIRRIATLALDARTDILADLGLR